MPYTLTPFIDPLKIPQTLYPNGHVAIHMINANVKLHSELPPTPLWTYEGSYLGPTLDVRRGQRVRVEYKNNLTGTLPVKVVEITYPENDVPADDNIPQNRPGSESHSPIPGTDTLKPYTVVHLHGGKTRADSDGWPDNVQAHGQVQTDVYDNAQRATMLWYHDHAMAVTRLNVQAGLAGAYIIRDHEEDELGLPKGKYEIPLVVQDRNFEVDATGNLTGQLLHKTEPPNGPMEFFGPYTLVNGTVWPHCDVEPRHYRLRWLNGSNARTYRLVFTAQAADGSWQPIAFDSGFAQQIGTEAGLLESAVNLPKNGLILASAERADVIVDFSKYKGKIVRVYNTAEAPFGFADYAGAPDAPVLADRRPYPQVMEFRVKATGAPSQLNLPARLCEDFRWRDHNHIPHTAHRAVALVEELMDNQASMLKLHELVPVGVNVGGVDVAEFNLTVPNATTDLVLRQRVDELAAHGERLLTLIETRKNPVTQAAEDIAVVYRSAANGVYDAINFMVEQNSTEVWKIINISADTHPLHVHLAQLQPLWRKVYNDQLAFNPSRSTPPGNADLLWPGVDFNGSNQPIAASAVDTRGTPYADTHTFDDQINRLDANEKALKDTIRINPGEVLAFAATFEGLCGRYMYHCHILEHEDREMMRPLVVLPKELHALMPNMDHGHHH